MNCTPTNCLLPFIYIPPPWMNLVSIHFDSPCPCLFPIWLLNGSFDLCYWNNVVTCCLFPTPLHPDLKQIQSVELKKLEILSLKMKYGRSLVIKNSRQKISVLNFLVAIWKKRLHWRLFYSQCRALLIRELLSQRCQTEIRSGPNFKIGTKWQAKI